MVPPIRVWLYGTVGAYLCVIYRTKCIKRTVQTYGPASLPTLLLLHYAHTFRRHIQGKLGYGVYRHFYFVMGWGNVWLAQDVGDFKCFIHQFKLRLSDYTRQSWHDDINTSYKCELYKEVKSLLEPEKISNN